MLRALRLSIARLTLRRHPNGVVMQTRRLRLTPSQIAASLAGLAVFVAATFDSSAQSQQNEVVTETGFLGIEGPAVDRNGTLYFVHYEQTKKGAPKMGKISQLKPGATQSRHFADLTGGTIGNGIRFDKDGRMYVADYPNHNVLVFEKDQTTPKVYFPTNGTNGLKFNQPNDLAIARDGTLYASDPNFGNNTGRIWRIARDAQGKVSGAIMTAPKMGTTNGLDLSPDDKKLYVAESNTKKVQAYRIEGTTLVFETTIKTLPEGDPDGLRTDADGRIYVAQNGGQRITRFRPDGSETLSIKTNGAKPSNLTFGGPDGKTVFVTQVSGGFVESFRVDRPGREFCKPYHETAC